MLEDLVIGYLIGLVIFLLLGFYIFFRYKVDLALDVSCTVNGLNDRQILLASQRFYNGYLRYALIWPFYLFVKMVTFSWYLITA